MYPAARFDSVDHRRLMAIAERTKSRDRQTTLYEGSRGGRRTEPAVTTPVPATRFPLKPAHWATVWDTLRYTDTGFIGDYLGTELASPGWTTRSS
jgi:hypothetical protein